jgi:MFS superfamily sulfate permease-like transporter
MASTSNETPLGSTSGFTRYFRYDFKAGFFVFLIALPLCLGIAAASGFPPIAGLFTAIIGGLVTTFVSNSEMTIKGPAAGLIVIVLGCVNEFGGGQAAYRAALAVGMAAAVLQIGFGLFRGGVLAELFPKSVVHGMLAAIGIIIVLKQFPVALGTSAVGEPLEIIEHLPRTLMHANPTIAVIGVVCLAIMFGWPLMTSRVKVLKPVPAPLAVLFAAIPMTFVFGLQTAHSYEFAGTTHEVGPVYLVSMPDRVFGMFDELATPDFSVLSRPIAWKWVLMFFLIGSIESLLSARAVDLLDPYKRRTNLNRDIAAVGVGNVLAAFVGGLPMISEIVRSRANIDNGARTRFANLWHAVLLLVSVAMIPMTLHLIPLAALAAMLVYTGLRLAHPREFVHALQIGREQLIVFVSTVIGVLATDLLIGVGIGIAVKVLFHMANGVPLSSFFKPFLAVEMLGEQSCLVRAERSAVFSNWLPFRRQLIDLAAVQKYDVTLDMSGATFIDHSTMEKLYELESDIVSDGGVFRIVGLDTHSPLSAHELAARKATDTPYARIEVFGPTDTIYELADELERETVAALRIASCNLPRSAEHVPVSGYSTMTFVCPRSRAGDIEVRIAARADDVTIVTTAARAVAFLDSGSTSPSMPISA